MWGSVVHRKRPFLFFLHNLQLLLKVADTKICNSSSDKNVENQNGDAGTYIKVIKA
ncbi:hypothetical protein M758_7G114300 [Ceratodon purpureus]|uniref:Uncharacterized protein n=1 Tax=Ceratodon purpureus TaxID=3225 RepID=A0A8T0H8R5_CERPU|nr:hypothetical protein KC19_7G162200 [Ceratodon purpureus]KAG0611087.1 hypothetical protein M758_7G114300 [Ceratodon purpureus]